VHRAAARRRADVRSCATTPRPGSRATSEAARDAAEANQTKVSSEGGAWAGAHRAPPTGADLGVGLRSFRQSARSAPAHGRQPLQRCSRGRS